MSQTLDSIRIFFVGGQGKSGTTWLELLLNAHPQISCRGEAHFGDFLLPLLDRVFEEYRGFIQKNNAHFRELQGYPAEDVSGVASAARAWIMASLYNQMKGDKNTGNITAVGERTPANIEHIRSLAELLPDCRFIHVIRDPRDIAVSLWFHGQRTNPTAFEQQYGSLGGLAAQLAPIWARAIQSARSYGASLGNRYHEARYEDLHAEPKPVLHKIFEFLDVSATDEMAQNCIDAAEFTKVAGRKPGAEDKNSHFRKGIVGDWRNHMEDATAQVFTDHAGQLLQDLGYS